MTKLVGIIRGGITLKRWGFWLFIVPTILSAVLFSTFFSNAFAQGGPADQDPPVVTPLPIGGPGTFPIGTNGPGVTPIPNPNPGGGSIGGGGTIGGGGGADSGQAAAAQAAPPIVQPLGEFDNPILRMLHSFVLGVGWFVGVFGGFFDWSVSNFIIGFGDKYANFNIGVTIESLWSTVRDIFNLTFIFGLVYIGFRMILDSSDSNARKMLVSLIGAALLVNFSLFITKFVIDFSNIAAFQVYKAFAGTAANGSISLSTAFANQMGIDTLLAIPRVEDAVGYQFVLGLLIVFLVLGYVFLAGAIMITIRFASLCIYMVFSPMMFLGWVFPALKGYSEKYWSGFLRQAFFAPAFIFMLYLSYRVADAYKTEVQDFGHLFGKSEALAQGAELPGTIPYFVLVVVFLFASMIVAKNMGAVGAATTVSIGNKIRGSAQGMLYRNTAGAAINQFGVKGFDRLDRAAARGGISGSLAKVTRGVLGGESSRKLLEKGANYGAGGYGRADVEKMNKERGARASGQNAERGLGAAVSSWSSLSSSENNIALEQQVQKAPTATLIETLRNHKSESGEYKRIVQAMSQTQVSDLLKSKEDEFKSSEKDKLRKARSTVTKERLQKDDKGYETGFSKASADDLAALGFDELLLNAQFIPGAKLEELKTKLTATEYQQLDKKRSDELEDLVTTGKANLVFKTPDGKSVKKDKDIAKLPRKVLIAPQSAEYLNSNVLNTLLHDDVLNESDREAIIENIYKLNNGHPVLENVSNWLSSTPAGKSFVKRTDPNRI